MRSPIEGMLYQIKNTTYREKLRKTRSIDLGEAPGKNQITIEKDKIYGRSRKR